MAHRDFAKMDARNYQVKFGTIDLGWCQDVQPQNWDYLTLEKTVGQYGQIVLDRVHLGLNPQISVAVVLQEVDPTIVQDLSPWWTSGPATIGPATPYYSEYDNSEKFTLHPELVSGTAEDVVMLHAFPVIQISRANAAQQGWRNIPATFRFYPDRTLLAAGSRVWGYFGGEPT
jgi:hypothetical protein